MKKIVYQSFYGAPLTFSYVFFKGKFCVSAYISKSLQSVYCLNSSEDPCWKNDISGFIWHESFIQTVKCSFVSQELFIKVSMACYSCLVIFFFNKKFCV